VGAISRSRSEIAPIAIRPPPPAPSLPPVHWLSADPTDPASLAAAVAAVAAHAPRIHRLIICTGILHGGSDDPDFRPEKSLGQLQLAHLQQCMAVNAWAPLVTLDAFAPLLRHDSGATAAVLSAMVGSITDNRMGGWYSYRMSKAALNMGIRNAAIELGRHRHGPVVVAIHPGTTLSPLSAPFAGPERARPPVESAAAILRVLDNLERADSGRFFNWDGRELPW
jgi:NAD(P)-dependent dehydrogenase (short-subunit alcohol dehydrogenase family)